MSDIGKRKSLFEDVQAVYDLRRRDQNVRNVFQWFGLLPVVRDGDGRVVVSAWEWVEGNRRVMWWIEPGGRR
jgi:hypothetical protein